MSPIYHQKIYNPIQRHRKVGTMTDKTFKLNTGQEIPALMFGTPPSPSPPATGSRTKHPVTFSHLYFTSSRP